jgi:hypothetical protein
MTTEDKRHYESIVLKRIPMQWRGDIRVDEVGQVRDGGRAGDVYVRISTKSKLGRAQAMMSIGSYVSNDPGEWSNGWERDGGRFTFVAYEPSVSPRQQTLVELADA